jgi:hypothetical protein
VDEKKTPKFCSWGQYPVLVREFLGKLYRFLRSLRCCIIKWVFCFPLSLLSEHLGCECQLLTIWRGLIFLLPRSSDQQSSQQLRELSWTLSITLWINGELLKAINIPGNNDITRQIMIPDDQLNIYNDCTHSRNLAKLSSSRHRILVNEVYASSGRWL